ncbi:(2Fe-2S)-binding protein [Sphaerisporangium sp. B11E5]|uniref:(2Fe-2S)-binding protein n=1 Tax=Sphaerisporangium sp. B11E5 TaxID=3153563 RepID=UPI00325F3C30
MTAPADPPPAEPGRGDAAPPATGPGDASPVATGPGDASPVATGPGGTRPTGPEEVVTALTEVSAFGPYFAVATGPREEPGWRPLAGLAADEAGLREWIAGHGRRLGTGESRVAASILYQGLAARLWSPVVGVAAAYGLVPAAAGSELRWRPAATGPLPLWSPPSARWPAVPDARERAAAVYRAVMTEVLTPLAEAVGRLTGVAPALLRGNASAALAAVLKTVPAPLAGRAGALVGDVLPLGELDGTGGLAEPAPGAYFFVRRSCCLYYRVPGGGLCEDCALLPREQRELIWARATGTAR